MPKLKIYFNKGIMDKDSDRSDVPNGMTRNSENMRYHVNDGNDGIGNNIKGTTLISDKTDAGELPSDYKCIGRYYNKNTDCIYYALASTLGFNSKIIEYNIKYNYSTVILEDSNGTLNFNKNGFITGWDEINGLQIWSEWGNNIRRINTERAKTYGVNGFTEDDIALIVKPPIYPLTITLEKTDSILKEENNIEEEFLRFSYRWKYLDGEYSVLAPFTQCAFEPGEYEYDLSQQTHKSMANAYNQVKIEFNTGNERVTEIQLVFIKSESILLSVIDDFNKEKLGYADNATETFYFNNSKIYRVLSENILRSFFSNVPLTNQAQQLIEGRLLIGNYKENFNIIDDTGAEIEMDYDLEVQSLDNSTSVLLPDGEGGTYSVDVATGIPKRTVKSNRDYEVGIVYLEDAARQTTVLNSKTNTIFLESVLGAKENSIIVNLRNKPPVFATHYRFFIRQPKKNYDSIIPVLFYEDGGYRWIKLEGADKDKVREGDYLIVKNDSAGIKSTFVKTKVLEVKEQEKNFLSTADVVDTIKEKSGLYFKIKPTGFKLSTDDFENYQLESYDSTRKVYQNTIQHLQPQTDGPEMHAYVTDPVNVCSVVSSTVNTLQVRRYVIEIDDDTTSPEKFKWSVDDGATWYDTLLPITGSTQNLTVGGATLSIIFENLTGHTTGDRWTYNSRPVWDTHLDSRSYGFFRFFGGYGEILEEETYYAGTFIIGKLYQIAELGTTDFTLIGSSVNTVGAWFFATGVGEGTGSATRENYEDENIENGAVITLEYDEYGRGDTYFKIENISSDRYDNIQEWFYEENILADILAEAPNFDPTSIHFVRGILTSTGGSFGSGGTMISQNNLGFMTMVIMSQEHSTTVANVKTRCHTTLFQTDGLSFLLFETEPKQQPPEIYHEIGKTYDIIGGYHMGDTGNGIDVNQTGGEGGTITPLKVQLDFFNAFSYGNSLESYKIRDEYNAVGLDIGVRVLTNIAEKYKEVHRVADVTWSDVYEDDSNFNGLNDFNLSLINFIKLDKENSSINKLHNSNGNLMVFQEDAIGILPYNKNIIYDAKGGATVGIITNILDKRSYRPYASGRYGLSNPEGFAELGNRLYVPDEKRGAILRLSNDGITELNEMYRLEHHITNEMVANKGLAKVGGIDPKHGEYLLNFPTTGTLAFKEKAKGFPTYFPYEPDMMLGANNEFYSWKDGRMYKHHASETYNNYYGVQYESKINFFVNENFDIEKIFNAIAIHSTHKWTVNLKTRLTERDIPKESFEKIGDHYYSEIMGNTNDNVDSISVFGLGSYKITNGAILSNDTTPIVIPSTLSVGDSILDAVGVYIDTVKSIHADRIILETLINREASYFLYSKNQNIDGGPIRGDILEVEIICDATDKVELRQINFEVVEGKYS